jgi:endonuclease G, mitochondrial
LGLLINSCQYDEPSYHQHNVSVGQAQMKIYTGFPETMESGSKGSYAASDVTLSTGSWNFNDALIGTLSTDRKNGLKSARIQNTGTLTMNFDVTNGVSQVTMAYAVFGTDASSTFTLWYSTNSGSNWTQTGGTITATSTTLTTATFNMTVTGNVRFQLRKGTGGRLNIDDFSIDDYAPIIVPDDDHLTMGNPSDAVTDIGFPNNYLLLKSQFAMAYNNSRGSCGWVSWHLGASDMGSAPRCDCFSQDTQLPSSFYRASSTAYTNSGFDRGHQCPSAERTDTSENNAATFKMSNMLPQAPNLNQITWNNMEDYERTLIAQGNELFIMSGGYGSGGTGSLGGITTTINSGKITVPSRCWKVIVVMPNGSNDLNRVSTSTRVIAVDMPNTQTVSANPWGYYRVTVDSIEAMTGYDFLSNVSTTIQNTIEASIDNGPTQ